ncbi:MAG: hypothetical protein MR672_07635 [Oscillibacter sp.]|nr:hypothetical protein [Oscillibacter sp.]MDY4395618.1 hypothetical protein [Oscillospiraceae bacterium]MDY4907989.1 hypothetical protein [Oscillospiraceae bacterium]HCG65830.1 hypothetical protein [Oscillibacter sp.]
MDLREILFAQFPAFFLLSLLFLAAHLRVRKHSAVKSVLWVLLFGAALAVSILFCFLGMQAKYWTVKTLFKLKFWSWLGLAIVVVLLVLRIVFKLQNKHTRHVMEKERAKAEKEREQAVAQAREEGRVEAMASQQAQKAEAAAEVSAPDAASDDAQNEMVGNAAEKEG